MDWLENLRDWFTEHAFSSNIIKYLVWVALVFVLIAWTRRWMQKNLHDNTIKFKSQKAVQVVGYLLIVLLTISYFTGSLKDFGLAVGLLTAGITITLQELILSIAGSFYIYFVRVYKPGDRIEINGIKGDVIDIDSMYTTMMEIGQWVSSDNYSGRIVKLSNAFVFKGPVYNYSSDFPFVWDEFDLPIRYGSDLELAKKIVIDVAQQTLSEYVEKSIAQWKDVVNKYYIEDAEVHPTLAISMTDNWVQFNLRYIVDYKKRRVTKHLLNEKIGQKIQETNGKVILASATFEIVSIPTVNINETKNSDQSK